MTDLLKSIILGVSAAALFGGIAMTLIHTGALKETVRLGAGIMVILALLYPISKAQVNFIPRWVHQNTDAIAQHVTQAQKQQKCAIEQTAAQEIQAYFMRKAKEHDILCDIEIHTTVGEDQTVSIRNATIRGTLTDEDRRWLQEMISKECGISQEDLRYVED